MDIELILGITFTILTIIFILAIYININKLKKINKKSKTYENYNNNLLAGIAAGLVILVGQQFSNAALNLPKIDYTSISQFLYTLTINVIQILFISSLTILLILWIYSSFIPKKIK